MLVYKKHKVFILSFLAIGLVSVAIIFYLFNQPHRNVQESKTDFSFNSNQIVSEYLSDPKSANDKYLDEEGDSKILEVTGIVNSIEDDFNGNKVLLLKNNSDKAGVSCTLLDKNLNGVKQGSEIKIKGVIRSGASYDSDMDLYENVIMEDCKIIK